MKSWMIDFFRRLTRGKETSREGGFILLVPPPLIASNALRAPIQDFCDRGKTVAEWIYFNFKE